MHSRNTVKCQKKPYNNKHTESTIAQFYAYIASSCFMKQNNFAVKIPSILSSSHTKFEPDNSRHTLQIVISLCFSFG